jgi:hypothetical protein
MLWSFDVRFAQKRTLSHDVRTCAGFGDDRSAVAVPDKDGRTILATEDAGDGANIICQPSERWLRSSDIVAVIGKNFINTFQPEPSANAPWTTTIFLTGAAFAGPPANAIRVPQIRVMEPPQLKIFMGLSSLSNSAIVTRAMIRSDSALR